MNSIETFSSPKPTSLGSDENDLAASLGSDPAALEKLRAMMGGAFPIQGLFVPANHGDGKDTSPASVASLLSKAMTDETLPPSLLPLVTTLSHSLVAKASSPTITQGEHVVEPPGGLPVPSAIGGSTDGLSSLRMALGQNPAGPISIAGDLASPLSEGTSAPNAPSPGLQLLRSGGGPDTSPAAAASGVNAQIKGLLNSIDSLPPSDRPGSLVQDLKVALAKALAEGDKSQAQAIEQKPNEASLGQSILQSIGAQSSAAASALPANGGPDQVASVDRIEQVSSLMTEMADQVLVTDPVHGQTPEVRIKIAENVIPGTEVRVWRDDGGQVRVEFDTTSAYWARALNEAVPVLTQRLNDRMVADLPAQVNVLQQGGQPEDGRSRNRQNPWELVQESSQS